MKWKFNKSWNELHKKIEKMPIKQTFVLVKVIQWRNLMLKITMGKFLDTMQWEVLFTATVQWALSLRLRFFPPLPLASISSPAVKDALQKELPPS